MDGRRWHFNRRFKDWLTSCGITKQSDVQHPPDEPSPEAKASEQPRALAQRLPEDILVNIAAILPVRDRVIAACVCQHWRFIIRRCAVLWTDLDLCSEGTKALPMLSELLLLSGPAPLDLSLIFTGSSAYPIAKVASVLAPHLHRVRSLSVVCPFRDLYTPLFALLSGWAPLLRVLDVSHGRKSSAAFEYEADVPVGFLSAAPLLETVEWGAHPLPPVMGRLTDVRNLRIAPLRVAQDRIFTLFPRLHTLYMDNYRATRDLERLPDSHPVHSLELSVNPLEDSPNYLSWDSLVAQGYTRVDMFSLRNYCQTVLFQACGDPAWSLRSLTIDYDDFLDAILVAGARECRMSEMAPSLSRDENVGKLMGETAWLRGLTSLTISLALSHRQSRPALLLPRGCLPALTTFNILCGAPLTNEYGHALHPAMGTLLDDALFEECGVLDAPSLHTICLLQRGTHPDRTSNDKFSIVSPSALARFISAHVQTKASRVPVLRIEGPGVRIANDEIGVTALGELVGRLNVVCDCVSTVRNEPVSPKVFKSLKRSW